MHGLEENVEVCIFYVESWLRGNGCIPVNFKMEDAATAEISRAQVSLQAPTLDHQRKAGTTESGFGSVVSMDFSVLMLHSAFLFRAFVA